MNQGVFVADAVSLGMTTGTIRDFPAAFPIGGLRLIQLMFHSEALVEIGRRGEFAPVLFEFAGRVA